MCPRAPQPWECPCEDSVLSIKSRSHCSHCGVKKPGKSPRDQSVQSGRTQDYQHTPSSFYSHSSAYHRPDAPFSQPPHVLSPRPDTSRPNPLHLPAALSRVCARSTAPPLPHAAPNAPPATYTKRTRVGSIRSSSISRSSFGRRYAPVGPSRPGTDASRLTTVVASTQSLRPPPPLKQTWKTPTSCPLPTRHAPANPTGDGRDRKRTPPVTLSPPLTASIPNTQR